MDAKAWIGLIIILLAAFMELLDVSVVSVAIPAIQRDIDATYAQIQWTLAGYQLAFAAGIITGGRLGDILGVSACSSLGSSPSWSPHCCAGWRPARACSSCSG
jgi:MFS family permease